jgi:hypothetical protein
VRPAELERRLRERLDTLGPAPRAELLHAESNRTVPYEVTSESGSVDWENYSPSVKARIDSLAAAGDCSGLQREFDIADENDDAQRARVGSGNADLMDYVDAKLSEAGCYE